MKRLVLLAFLLVSINYLFAQKQGPDVIDSLKIRLKGAIQDTSKVRLMGKLAFQYYRFDTDSGIYYARQAISLAEKLKWGTGLAFSWNYLGTNYAVKGNFVKALECFNTSLSNYTAIADQQGIAFLSNNLGNFYRIQKNYSKAKEFIERAILINEGLRNKAELAKDYNNLGCVFEDMKEFGKSDSCYRKGLIIAEQVNNQDMMAQLLINVAENKFAIKDFCGALESGIKAVKISEKLNIQYDGAVYNGYVGEIYLKLSGEEKLPVQNCPYYSNKRQSNLLSAKNYISKSIELLDRVNDRSLLSENALLLSTIYEKLGDQVNALKFYKLFVVNKDSVSSTELNIKLANLEKTKEVELKDNKIKIQTLEIAHQRSQMKYQIILFLLILLVISFILYSYYKTKVALSLTASEEKYRTIFENLQDIFYRIDLNGIILDISPSIERFSDYTREEIIGRQVFDFYSNTEERKLFVDAILKNGELRDWELKFKTKSDEKFVSINARLICDSEGKPNHINGAMRDITERKGAEAELQASREKYQKDLVFLNSIFESPVDIIMFALDKNYCYTAFTQFHKKTIKIIWGVDIQIGMNMIDLISNEEDRKKAKFNFDRALGGEHFIETEEYGDSSLQRTFYEDYYSSVKSSEGNIVGVAVFVIDVTHRKKTEKQLELLNRAIEQSPVTVMITDKEGKIEYVNPNFAETTGYSYEEILGQNPRLLQSGEQSDEFYTNLWETILSGKNWIGEIKNKKKDGVFYDESVVISPINSVDRGISHFVAVKTDITQRKTLMLDLIKAKEQSEESDKLKTAFLNNISHEIRTPFNGILGFLSMLQWENLSVNERNEYHGFINKSAKRLMNTINEIVEIAQIQTGQTKLALSETKISVLISELTDIFKNDVENQGLIFSISNELSEMEDSLISDYSKLRSILSKIIDNALKFTITGSITIYIRIKGDYLQFIISDTGIGIAENKQLTIFDRFIQADISSTRKFDGPGLGLSISKAYAEMLGGNIEVESEEGRGSSFCVSFPYSAIHPKAKVIKGGTPLTEGIRGWDKSLKILIAEDDEQSALLIQYMIKIYGNNVLKAANGIEAVTICRQNPDLDLVLMDIKMPLLDGYEATKQIRKFNPEIVIIAQTAFALSGDMEKAIEAGCNDYISKPINKSQLMVLLKKYFKV